MSKAFNILSDPHWFPVKLDAEARSLHFVRTDRQALSDAAFLDERFQPAGTATQSLSLNEIALHEHVAAPPPNWIFHTAFCCSTLMARALDVPGKSLSLKEPGVLMDLANAKRMASQWRLSAAEISSMTEMVFTLLARRFAPGEAIIIKPTNPATPLAAEALTRNHKVLFMVSELRDFLISVIKKGEACRAFMRTVFNIFSLDHAPLGQIPQRQALTFTDLQIACLVQRHQMELLTVLGDQHPNFVRAFDGNKLPDAPQCFLQATADHFGLPWIFDTASEQAKSAVFETNSKFGSQSYNANTKSNDAANIEATHHDAIETTLNWAKSVQLGGAVKMPPGPLLT